MGNLTSRLPWKRTLQEDIDLWRAYQLVYYREKCKGQEVRVEEIKGAVPRHIQREVVDESLIKQIKLLTEDRRGGDQTSAFPLFSLQVNTLKGLQDSFPIPGVTLVGHAFPGSVVCFFPGLIYTPSFVHNMPNFPFISADNPYLMSATNGSIIDAKFYSQREEVTNTDNSNMFSVGHLVQHPPAGVLPNVMPYTLVLPCGSPVCSLIPNQYFKSSLHKGNSLLTIVFIAMRHIKNEELFLNYRLHPKSHLPSWYTPLDENEDKRRWKKIKHIS